MLEHHYQLTDQGHAFASGSSLFLAQIREKADGSLLDRDRVKTIKYSAYRLDHSDPTVKSVVEGHETVSLNTYDVFFATPKLDGLWNCDDVGYNFKHEPIVASKPLFPTAGRHYLVEYRITLVDHPNDVIVRYRIQVL